jgi:type I restriction enzyme S subunit
VKFETTQLKYLSRVTITNGLGLPGEFDNPDWPRYIRTTDIAGANALREDVFASQPPEVAAKAPVEVGDILMTAAGATIGKSVRISAKINACYAGFLVRYRPNALVDGRFVAHWMHSQHYWDQIAAGAVRSTIDNFSASKYRELQVPLPLVEEQRRIADFLDDQVARIDEVIHRIESAEALSTERWHEQLRSAVFGLETCSPPRSASGLQSSSTHGAQGLLVTELPYGWTWAKLNRIARLGTGHTPDRNRSDYWEDCSIPWVTAADLSRRLDPFAPLLTTTQHISELGLANSAAVLHPANTVMLCRTASVGLFCITAVPMATTQAFVTWTPLDDLQGRYLLYLMAAYASEFDRLAYGSTHRTIYMPDLEAIRIPLPPMRHQESIVERLDSLNEQRIAISVSQHQLTELLEERKRAVITGAVTGELDVTTARPIGVGKWVANVGASVDSATAAQAQAPSIGGIG